MRPRLTAAVLAVGLAAAAGLSGCTGGSTAAGDANSVLTIGMPNGPQTNNSNPFLGSSAGASLGYRYMIYEPLVMMNPVRPAEKGRPWLATKWSWSDNYRKLTLTVRDSVTWSDGKPMTAADVAYTFDLLKSNDALNTQAIPYKSVSVSGDTVNLTFDSSQYVNQTKILTQFVVPQHIWKSIKDPATDPVKKPVGTGPYTLTSFTSQTITLTRRSSYWQHLPKVKKLLYTSYNDNSADITALGNGQAEWSFVFVPNYKSVFVDKDPQHNKIWFPPTLGVHGLWINTQRKPFDDPALRKAMSMVIDRDDILDQGEAGYFYPKVDSPTGIPTPAGDPFISEEFQGKKVTVDVAGAKKLLKANGFRYRGSTLLAPSGKPVTLTLTDPAGWSDYITDLTIIKDNLADLGIKATVNKANEDAWTKNIDTGNFDAAMHWTNSGTTPYDMYQNIMDSSLYKPVGTGGVAGNYGRYRNAAATKALNRYANASTDSARSAALDTLQQIMADEVPVIVTSAANLGGEYSTRHWVGWPDAKNPYAPEQPTQINALDVVLHLRPAS